jgi:hypothetical protein
MWALIVDDCVELVRDEAPRDVVLDDGYCTPITLTDAELAERGWVQVVEVESPGDGWVVEILPVDGIWTQVWREETA